MTPAERAAPTTPAPPPKACGCGVEHDAFAWARLPLVGRMGDLLETLELKNCSACHSTLAIVVGA